MMLADASCDFLFPGLEAEQLCLIDWNQTHFSAETFAWKKVAVFQVKRRVGRFTGGDEGPVLRDVLITPVI